VAIWRSDATDQTLLAGLVGMSDHAYVEQWLYLFEGVYKYTMTSLGFTLLTL
jgi:hypothetical protein